MVSVGRVSPRNPKIKVKMCYPNLNLRCTRQFKKSDMDVHDEREIIEAREKLKQEDEDYKEWTEMFDKLRSTVKLKFERCESHTWLHFLRHYEATKKA